MVSQGFPESRFPNHNFRGGLGCSELTGTPEPFRKGPGAGQEVTEQGPSCWLTALLRGAGTSRGQAKEQSPTNHQAEGTKGQH